jgi:hypothetical protein
LIYFRAAPSSGFGRCFLGAFLGIHFLSILTGLFLYPPGPFAVLFSVTVSACLISGFVFYVKRHVAVEIKSLEKMKASEASLLHYAAKYGDVDCCKARLAAGDDPDGSQELDATPLHCAGLGGCLEIAKMLIFKMFNQNRSDLILANSIRPYYW